MLDNKQRAHDLALIITEYQINNDEFGIDVLSINAKTFYNIYMRAYKMALESFNRDFPEEK